MKRDYLMCALCALFVIVAAFFYKSFYAKSAEDSIRVGYIYVGDASNAYTKNFMKAQAEMEEAFGEKVEHVVKYNIADGDEADALQELVDEKCDLIFGTSYGYETTMKQAAMEHPEIQFCQASGRGAEEEPILENYHTFMGHIYEGRYISGIAAGMKLQEMVERGVITPKEALVGYVTDYPYSEVISGYTAFFLGIRKACPYARMKVLYMGTWNDYMLEKKCAEKLIEDGCIIIGQHADTSGTAVACESARKKKEVYHIDYNQSMRGLAPTATLAGCRINWEPYMVAAVSAVLNGKSIEKSCGKGVQINGNDAGAGFKEDWVKTMDLNEVIAAPGTAEMMEVCIEKIKKGEMHIFQGNYIGVDPFDETDIYDLQTEYKENVDSSYPKFHYVLQDVIETEYYEETAE